MDNTLELRRRIALLRLLAQLAPAPQPIKDDAIAGAEELLRLLTERTLEVEAEEQ